MLERRQLAWDAGTGNGQAAVIWSDFFDQVIATDPSASQLEQAMTKSNVRYLVAAESPVEIKPRSLDLISVSQALHWFDLDRFYRKAKSALKINGILAVWCYSRPSIDAEMDEPLREFHFQTIGSYWPPQRALVDSGYRDIDFPNPRIETPGFEIVREWNLEQLLQYVGTWSSVQRYIKANKSDPVELLREKLEPLWGDRLDARKIVWPVHLLCYRNRPDKDHSVQSQGPRI